MEAVWQLDSSHRPAVRLCVEDRGRFDSDPRASRCPAVTPTSINFGPIHDADGDEIRQRDCCPSGLRCVVRPGSRPCRSLRALYGAGTLDIDFRSMGERARGVRVSRSDLRYVEADVAAEPHGSTHPRRSRGGDRIQGDLGSFCRMFVLPNGPASADRLFGERARFAFLLASARLMKGSTAKWRNWQTHQTQNLALFTLRVGSTPTFATKKTKDSHTRGHRKTGGLFEHLTVQSLRSTGLTQGRAASAYVIV